ncbi:TetR/AcrR family transcriptional regulator C-terminal domain-containing protein [Microbacterium sp. zg-YB36]|uniref:TetR/AcrR family transcriptional regulator n=1 Tax=Microbacterium sp. zg-YB36 TaxID=2969407 RepID=UPI00214A9F2A|nr:TetR/AcrR family transcriptional regulator C-terminal domain-containing protein [Microbacterium sp. zg-YB36]MDL5350706.1 TetR/AcrR family transcriptional regulator C-terminal domain-containing protein [Microbacterium sp. zg-YB36]
MSTAVPRRPLDRERVLDAAITFADQFGLEGASMRRVADVLGVTPMALYKHVANRDQLIDGMLDRLVASIDAPATGLPWQEALRARIRSARAVMNAHPWAQTAIETRATASPTVLAYMDSLMAIMFEGGLSADLVHHAMHALSTRMWGITRDVLPTPAVPEDPIARAQAMAAFAGAYPAIVRMASTAPHAGAACDDDAEFAFALDLLIDGFARLHEQGWASTSAPGSGHRIR